MPTKSNVIAPAEIPPHMLENPQSNAQRKAFAKVKPAAEKAAKKAAKKTANETAADRPIKRSTSRRKAGVKRTATADSGYTLGAEKDESK